MDGRMTCTNYLTLVYENGDESHIDWEFVEEFFLHHTHADVVKIENDIVEVYVAEGGEIILNENGNSEFSHFGEVPSGMSTYDYIAKTRDITQIIVGTCDEDVTYFIPEVDMHCYRDGGNLVIKFG